MAIVRFPDNSSFGWDVKILSVLDTSPYLLNIFMMATSADFDDALHSGASYLCLNCF